MRERADQETITRLLSTLSGLETSEFFAEGRVKEPEVDQPSIRITHATVSGKAAQLAHCRLSAVLIAGQQRGQAGAQAGGRRVQ